MHTHTPAWVLCLHGLRVLGVMLQGLGQGNGPNSFVVRHVARWERKRGAAPQCKKPHLQGVCLCLVFGGGLLVFGLEVLQVHADLQQQQQQHHEREVIGWCTAVCFSKKSVGRWQTIKTDALNVACRLTPTPQAEHIQDTCLPLPASVIVPHILGYRGVALHVTCTHAHAQSDVLRPFPCPPPSPLCPCAPAPSLLLPPPLPACGWSPAPCRQQRTPTQRPAGPHQSLRGRRRGGEGKEGEGRGKSGGGSEEAPPHRHAVRQESLQGCRATSKSEGQGGEGKEGWVRGGVVTNTCRQAGIHTQGWVEE